MSATELNINLLPNVWNNPFPEAVTLPIRMEAAARFRKHQLPETKAGWETLRPALYQKIAAAMRLKYDRSLPLDYEDTGTLRLDGYSIKKISFCADRGRCVTALLYIPDGTGPFPAILNVHGHWGQGKVAAQVQARGHIFAQLGYVCLSVDAFGAGERATIHPGPEYHGLFLGASLLNINETLMGIQVADNMRAIDLLQSLPFVQPDKIGVTGASGGGNQTMYIAAMDDRVKAAVPVCSVGSYETYTRSANCFCELMPGGLEFTEESGLLALVAPRAIKICNAIDDSPVFSVKEMLRSHDEARKVFRSCGVDGNLSCEAFNCIHGYWPQIIEAAAGFFDLHLKNVGHGGRRPVPDFRALPEEELLVYPAGDPPEKLKSLKVWSMAKAEKIAAARKNCAGAEIIKSKLAEILTGKKKLRLNTWDLLGEQNGFERYHLIADDVHTPVLFCRGTGSGCRIIAADSNKRQLAGSRIFKDARKSGESILIFDPYGTGESYDLPFSLKEHPDYHNLARHCSWLGHSLLGIWVEQYRITARWAKEKFGFSRITLAGLRDAGIAALFAAALYGDSHQIIAEKCVTSMALADCAIGAATFALAVPDILLYADISTAVALSGAEVKLLAPVMPDGSELDSDSAAALRNECQSEAERCKTKLDLTIIG